MIKISTTLTLSFLISAVVVSKFSGYVSQPSIDKGKIEAVIQKKQAQMSGFLDQAKPLLLEGQIDIIPEDLLEIIDNQANENQTYLVVYRNWNLKIWPTQNIILPDVFDPDLFTSKIVQLGNSYYLPLYFRHGNLDIVILSFIKTQFGHKSEYLTDEFAKSYGMPENVSISFNPLSDNRIYDSGNNYLFSLEPGKTSFWGDFLFWFSMLLFIAAIVSFFRLTESIVNKLSKNMGVIPAILIALLFAFGVRFCMLLFKVPDFIYHADFFGPELYASGMLSPSLGDSMLNIFWIFFFILLVYVKMKGKSTCLSSPIRRNLFLISSGLILSVFAFHVAQYIPSLVSNSTIEFEMYKIIGVSGYTFIGLLNIIVFVTSYLLLVDLFIILIRPYAGLYKIALFQIPTLLIILTLLSWIRGLSNLNILFFVTITIGTYYYRSKNSFRHSFAVTILGLISMFFVLEANHTFHEKWFESKKVVAYRLSSIEDLSTELQLRTISEKIVSDTMLIKILSSSKGEYVRASNYVSNRYFSEISRLYNVGLLFFNVQDSIFVDTSHQQWQPWRKFYNAKIGTNGVRIMDSDYFRFGRQSGLTRYTGFHPIPGVQATSPTLVVELDEKSFDLNQGLHSVLLQDNYGIKTRETTYSFANYFDNKLVSKSGNYNYKTVLTEPFKDTESTVFQLEFDNFRHLVYQIDNRQTLVISDPEVRFYDLVIWFSYVFVTYYIILVLVSIVFGLPFVRVNLVPTIQNRIQLTMATALLLSIMVIGIGSIYFNFQSSQRKHMEMIDEKIRSVVNEMCGNFAKVKELYKYDEDYINFLMRKYSNVFNIDVTLFDVSGNLAATSRKELYDDQFVSKKMNFAAFQSMTLDKSSKSVFFEKIGNLNYYSAYVPLQNSQGTVLGFINLPFFSHDGARTRDLSSMVVALINIYVLLILFTILLAVFVSNKVTKPLLIVRKKLQELDIKRHNTPIEYHSNDEIGDLVREYNRMVHELSRNTEILAQRERESAWQSMARQVAHEIKNPLTPMKLNIQLLERAWDDHAHDFDKRLHKVCNTLVEQIDALSNIASEFSAFAKMPKEKLEILDVNKTITSCVNLFEDTKNTQIIVEEDITGNAQIFADNDQVIRVFTNLIKNAIQAIPEERLGLIKIKIKTTSQSVQISISDNGEGITPEMQRNLFQPNFTTKNSGMGLGLAMVKNIIIGMNGTIWFETLEHKGTTFYMEIPRYESVDE